jgi:putative FmdB family regulatory protein
VPTYEYECDECGQRFEQFQSIKADPIQQCPRCGGNVRRLIGSGAAIIFKGAGFHATDYRRSNIRCGREGPCCGRNAPCDQPPCDT